MLSRVWLAAQAVWGHKWTAANGDLPIGDDGRLTIAGALWAEGLRGLTERQVLDTLGRLAKAGSEWPPNLPELRRAALGIPDFAEVNRELLCVASAERTAFARLAWSYIDGYAHRHASARDAERMRREAYERASDHVLHGGELPAEPAAAIGQQRAQKPQGIPTTTEGRRERLQQILAKVDPNHELRVMSQPEHTRAEVERELAAHYAAQQSIPSDPTGEVE